ncbi:CDF family Co(II)/Ni(II) efflux transporter DmeF [Halarcobacter bivalviorum]|uniref:CDF family Co(II)/Ni(II) efflux transporter DmeF n=1 Tax=Halarcobacter bivalviorum TaxID=663364 RepID=UPI00100A848E|nr:CDF family Co(II)/Ni(II) efflux transporter DmeF [Halarcobacter bivalviorum]RXK03346.1 cation transporter [Halarcobacter bivalviorum]
MQTNTILENLSHSHSFDDTNQKAKRNTLYATILTFVMMIAEITAGLIYNSMALLADGWHMSSHALALGLSFFAYAMATKYKGDIRFSFGTFKIEILGAYTSAILLLVVAFFMAFHSIERFLNPVDIHYKEAIFVAVLGLIVNLICAWLLKDDHSHHHGHDEHHHHEHEHSHSHDMNLKAAYLHVLADALTSILAIVALIAGMLWGAAWLDPVMGIVGSVLVFVWAIGLIKQSGKVLLDANMDAPVVGEIIEVIENSKFEAKIVDIHVWHVGKGKYSCILSLEVEEEIDSEYFKNELSIYEELVHITIEVNKLTQP